MRLFRDKLDLDEDNNKEGGEIAERKGCRFLHDEAELEARLARLEADTRKCESELSALKQAAETGDMDAQMQLAGYYHRDNNYKQALVYYGLAAEKDNKNAIRMMAELYRKCKRLDEAEQCYRRLEAVSGKAMDLELGKLLLEKGDKPQAVEYLRKAAKAGKKEAVQLLEKLDYVPDISQLERMALMNGCKDAALELGEYYYEKAPRLSAFWYHFAYTHNYVRPLDRECINKVFGKSHYCEEEVRRLDEGSFGIFKRTGTRRAREIRAEIESKEQSAESDNDPSLLAELGDLYESLGEYESALQRYFMAMDGGCEDVDVRVAVAYMRAGDLSNGMHWLQKAADRNDLNAYNYLARIYEEMNDRENQLKCCLKLSELGNGLVDVRIAELYEAKMEFSKALFYYKRYWEHEIGQPGKDVRMENKIHRLERMCPSGHDAIDQLEKVFNTYRKQAKIAAIKLGTCYYEGTDIEPDYQKSAFWYRQAGMK